MNDVTPLYASTEVGILTLIMLAAICYMMVSEWIDYLIHRRIDRDGFFDPRLNEMTRSLRVLGMKPTTYSLVKALLLTAVLAFGVYAGKPALVPLFNG